MAPPNTGQFLDNNPSDATVLLSVAEAAKVLGVSASGMRRLQQERRIPFFKVGRRVRFARTDLATYLAKHRVESVG
jgi:excisionase family DNA binding protein